MEDKGQKIPGSKFLRDYCYICKEPIRIPQSRIDQQNCCTNCPGSVRNNEQAMKRESNVCKQGRRKTST